MRRLEIKRPSDAIKRVKSHQHTGPRTPIESQELLDILDAYRKGATGSIVIGTRRGSRVLTVMLPAASSREAAISQMRKVASQLQRLRCENYLYARRMRLRIEGRRWEEAIVINNYTDGYNSQRIEISGCGLIRTLASSTGITDELASALDAAFRKTNALAVEEEESHIGAITVKMEGQ